MQDWQYWLLLSAVWGLNETLAGRLAGMIFGLLAACTLLLDKMI